MIKAKEVNEQEAELKEFNEEKEQPNKEEDEG